MIKTKWEREQTPWIWANFAYEFKEKYIPPLVQEKREDEFIRLWQEISSVAEYEAQFIKLSKFFPELVPTEQKRVRQFVQGLNWRFSDTNPKSCLCLISRSAHGLLGSNEELKTSARLE